MRSTWINDMAAAAAYRQKMLQADPAAVRRLIYSSKAVRPDLNGILRQSRSNNGIDGVSGILVLADGEFVQVLEGPPESVAATFERIKLDPRHSDIVVVSDTVEAERVFGGWAMAGDLDELGGVVRARLGSLLDSAPPHVRNLLCAIPS